MPTQSSSTYLPPGSRGFSVLLGMIVAIQAIGTTFTLPAIPYIARDLNTSPDMAQLTIGVYLLCVACGQIVAGALSDRFGRRPVLLGGLALTAAASFGCTFAPSIGTLIALRAVQGFGSAAGMILARAIVRDLFERERALKTMAGIVSVTAFAPLIGPPLVAVLMQWMSWRGVYGLISAIGAVLGIMAWKWIAESLKTPDPAATDPARIVANCREMLRRPDAMGFVLVTSLSFGALFSFLSIIAFIATDTFGLEARTAGWMIIAMTAASWFGAILNNRTSGRWPVRTVLRASTATAMVACFGTLAICAALTQGALGGGLGIAALLATVTVFGLSFGFTHPTTMVMYLQPLPHIAGIASAFGASIQMVSGALFAWLAGYLYDGTPMALGYCMVLGGLGAFLIYTFMTAKHSPK